MGRTTALEFKPRQTSPNYLISITDPDLEVPKFQDVWDDVLQLQFYDVNQIEYWHLDRMYDYITKHLGGGNIYAHCEMGVSRSAAVREYLVSEGYLLDPHVEVWETDPNTSVLEGLRFRRWMERGE